jgi:hypothetical protein
MAQGQAAAANRFAQRYAAYAFTQRRMVARKPIGLALSEMTGRGPHHSEPGHIGSMFFGRLILAGYVVLVDAKVVVLF